MPRGTDRQAVVSTADAHRAVDGLQDDPGLLVYGRGAVWGRKGMRQARWLAGKKGEGVYYPQESRNSS